MATAGDFLTTENLPLGAHLVMFYESQEEHRSTVLPYLVEGLRRREKVLYLYSEYQPGAIEGYLADVGLDPKSFVSSGQLEFIDAPGFFGQQDGRESARITDLLRAEIDKALAAGFEALRASGEVAWQAAEPHSSGLYDYHKDLNEFLAGTKCILLCEYDKRKMHPEAIQEVLTAHPLLLQGHQVARNPFYGQAGDLGDATALAGRGGRWMECISDLQHLMGGDRPAERDLMAAVLDVTELRQLEQDQRESARRCEIVAQLTTDFIYEYNPVANEMRWFGDIDSYLGFSPGEAPRSYEGWMGIIHPDDRERVKDKLARTRRTGEPFVDEHRVIRADGTQLYWLGRATAMLDEDGAPTKFVGAVRDITARKAVDEDLMRSESRFRSLFENAPFGILIHRAGTLLFANRALLDLFGYTSMARVEGSSIFKYLTPESAEQVADLLKRRLAGEPVPNAYETTGLRRDGAYIPLYIVIVPLELDDGPALMVYMMDITERKNYENALRGKAEELKNFLTIAAHELRHPITILKGYTRVLEDLYENEMIRESLPETLHNIDKASSRLDRLVDELLDVSRIEQGRFELRKEELDVAGVLARAAEELKVEGLTNPLSWQVAPGAASFTADPDKIDRLLLILLQNASNFSPPDSPIEMAAQAPTGGEILISVLDRGSGIPEDSQERVFDRFYQVDEVEYHSIPGLGMGLYIARQIVDAHAGRIWNEPREGGGTAFRFTLPLA